MSTVPRNNRKSHDAGHPAAGKNLGLRVLSSGRWQGQLIPIQVSPFVIGRHADCHLRPLSPLAGLKQGALHFTNGSVRIQNLAQKRDIRVNDRPIESEQELRHGDRLEVGRLLFEVVLQPEPIRNQPPSGGQLSIDEETVGALLLAIQDEPRTISLSRSDDTETTKVTAVARAARSAHASAPSPDDSDEMVWAARALLHRYNNPRLRHSRSHRPRSSE
jgi:FHA domain